jgi:DeoR family fructose operon transcriptional repressor
MNKASGRKTRGGALIAAERRRRIYDLALRRGAVSVSELAAALRVAENTIRNDLDVLEREGKLQRSHGGAVLRDRGRPAPPYQEMRVSHLVEKSWIGQAAARFLPESGSVFINAGSTAYQLALNIREGMGIQLTTNSPEIAMLVASNTSLPVDLMGGRMLRDSLETDGTLSEDVLESLYWDVVFYGMTAIDAEHGITSTSFQAAKLDRRVLSHGRRVVGLCDSSKFGLYASAKVGPLTLLDVVVTDSGVRPEHVRLLRDAGVEVVIADGPPQDAGEP